MKSEWKNLNLVDYLNNKLELEEREQVEKILAEDPKLRAELALMRREIEMMRSAGHDPHSDVRLVSIHDSVMSRIRSERRTPVLFNSTWLSYFRAVGVVLVLILALALFFILRPHGVETSAGSAEKRNPVVTIEDETGAKPVTLRLTTSNPKINIQWTVDPDFPVMD